MEIKTLITQDGTTYKVIKESDFCEVTELTAMRHFLLGGWIEDRDYSNASYFIKLDSDGHLVCRFKRNDEKAPKKPWERWHLTFVDYEIKNWRLIDAFKFEDEK